MSSNQLYFGDKVVFIGGLPVTLPTLASDPGSAVDGDMYYNTTSGVMKFYNGSWQTFGSVTDVGLVEGSEGASQTIFTIAGSPVIGTGTLTLSLASQPTGNQFLGTPNGSSGQPFFRSLVAADIPSLAYANQSLSNLSGPTSIGVDLLPSTTTFYNLGSSLLMWANLYAQNATVSQLTVASITTTSPPIVMGTDVSLTSNKITNLANGTNPGDAVNYSQLTSLVTGLVWQNPVQDPDLVDDSLSTPPVTPAFSLLYIIAASPTGAWTGLAGHAVWWDGSHWIDLSTGNIATSGQGAAVLSGARFLVASDTDIIYTFTVTSANATAEAVYTNNGYFFTVTSTIVGGTTLLTTSNGIPSGTSGTLTLFSGAGDATISFTSYTNPVSGGLVGHNHQIAVVNSNTPGSFTYTFTSPSNNWATSDVTPGSNHFGNSYTYSTTLGSWVNFSGPAKTIAGSALGYTGNTLNVLYDNTSIDVNGSNQLEVKNSGVTNAKLANMAANTVKANITGSPAAPTDVPFVSTNTVSSGVFRDSSGNFAANQITAAAFISSTANPASTGAARLASTDTLSFRSTDNTFNSTIGVANAESGVDAFVFSSTSGGGPGNAVIYLDTPGLAGRGAIYAGKHNAGNALPTSFVVNGTSYSAGFLFANDSSATKAALATAQYSSDASAQFISFGKARGTAASPTIVSNGDTIGALSAVAFDGTDFKQAAQIFFQINAAPGSGSMPGAIVFQTTQSGSITPTTALTINRNQTSIFAGVLTSSKAGAANASAVSFTGAPFTGGTASSTTPLVLIQNAGTSNNWNTSGTVLGINVATGFTGNLIDAQVNAVDKFKVDASGNAYILSSIFLGDGTPAEFMPLTTFTIADNQASPANVFSFASASYTEVIVDYSVVKNSVADGGTIYITNDTVNVAYANVGSSTGTTGVVFTATLSGGNIVLQYTSTSTGASGTMKYTVRRW